MEVKEDGYHVIFIRAAKGSKLYLGEKLIIEWAPDFKHDYYSYIMPLSKGFYPIRIEYFDKRETFNLFLYYLTPASMATKDPVPIPPDVQYRRVQSLRSSNKSRK